MWKGEPDRPFYSDRKIFYGRVAKAFSKLSRKKRDLLNQSIFTRFELKIGYA
jgi:hypothetical protein